MNKSAIVAWGLVVVITVIIAAQAAQIILNASPDLSLLALANDLLFVLVLPAFTVVGALIVSRQPRNVIGWLMFLPSIAIIDVEPYIVRFTTAPDPVSLRFWVSYFYSRIGWLFLIFPLFFIPVLFPTGRPPSPRWRWLIYAGLAMCGIFIFIAAFQDKFNMIDYALDWIYINPLGFIHLQDELFIAVWGIGLLLMTILSFSSLFIRYRGAAALEREQIKWLLFAVALFGVLYMLSFPIITGWQDSGINEIASMLWGLSLLGIPISIGIAILRYRLWDIDVIIRRTLIYGVLTVTLALVFLGAVTLLQALFSVVSGQRSAVATVISTLLIAALFSPLRRRIQNDIDRRFYRKKYNAEQAIERFAAKARQETDLEALSAELLAVVSETMQPESVGLWLSSPRRRNTD